METPIETPSSTPNELTQLKQECESLRYLVLSLLVLMIVISGTLNLFLLRQVKYSGSDLNNIKPQVMGLVADYNRSSAPAINDFMRKLSDFSRTHPDFAPIFQKYVGTNMPSAAPQATPAAAPAMPAAAPAPAKK